MKENTKVSLERRGPVGWIWLQRPEVHNAFDAELITQLDALLEAAAADPDLRVLVLAGRGRSFSAGGDLKWMASAAQLSDAENNADADRLATMLRRLTTCPQATVARVQGAAMGGGLGLVSACDMALASGRAKFGFSEVKLGLIPAVISPFVIEKIGAGRAQQLFLTGERFDAVAAERYGLVGQVLEDEAQLDAALEQTIKQLLSSGPEAVACAKELVAQVTSLPSQEVDAYTATAISKRRASSEAQEGIQAFFQKRPPAWATKA